MDEPLRGMRSLVVIAGPTGSGKSELALTIAKRFRGEIVNCDSVQVYRYFDIGAAKTPVAERRGVPHHLIDALDPDETFTAGEFSRVGRRLLNEISDRGHLPVVAGGTGFYIRALIDGLAPGPERDEALRDRLTARERGGPGSLHRILRRFDPRTAARIHANDVPKTMRALEICLKARRPATEVFEAGRDALEGFRVMKIGLFPDREALYTRLESRLEQMFASGLIDEVGAILAKGFPESAKPFESIGYKQALQTIRGEISPRDALFYARRDTRRYAKRQMTWFRREPGLQILRGFGDDPEIMQRANELIAEFLADRGC
ncbi:MAG TPA: tRNA (adenosine(37)-N6)-dimethylallyltransferase MiaA [Bryobacteraceae bacterium]|nr:tRNA (adenosine(37)-N6)-dimethylallyltransferase MiaA [Bryobacteraceae bacterium]